MLQDSKHHKAATCESNACLCQISVSQSQNGHWRQLPCFPSIQYHIFTVMKCLQTNLLPLELRFMAFQNRGVPTHVAPPKKRSVHRQPRISCRAQNLPCRLNILVLLRRACCHQVESCAAPYAWSVPSLDVAHENVPGSSLQQYHWATLKHVSVNRRNWQCINLSWPSTVGLTRQAWQLLAQF